jgi:hypothetical protein
MAENVYSELVESILYYGDNLEILRRYINFDIAGVNVTFRRAQKAKSKQKPHPELSYPEQ